MFFFALVSHPLQKILYSDHAIRIYCDLQYELRLCVALSFLSSRLRPGNMMPRIPRTVGSMKSWDATLTQTVRVGCSKLQCGNESWCSCRSCVARMQVLAPLGSESAAKNILRRTPSWLILTAAEGCSHWSFGDRTSLFCRTVGFPKTQDATLTRNLSLGCSECQCGTNFCFAQNRKRAFRLRLCQILCVSFWRDEGGGEANLRRPRRSYTNGKSPVVC